MASARNRIGSRVLLAVAAVALFAALAGAASARRVIIIVGPKTPNAHSTKGMTMRFSPRKGAAGTVFKGLAQGFRPGEYVTAWDFRGRRSSQLNGGSANSRGRITLYRQTAAGITARGLHKVCLQGERTRRVACANYRVTSTGGGTDEYQPPTEGPGYVPPETGPGYVPPGSA